MMESEFMDEAGRQIPVEFKNEGIHKKIFSYVKGLLA